MVARHAERHTARHRIHHETEAVDDLGAPVHQVAQKDQPPPMVMGDRETLVPALDTIAEPVQQRLKLVEAAVDVADDVERPEVVASIGPKRLALDDCGVDLFFGTKLETVAEPLAAQSLHGSSQQPHVVAHHGRPEVTVRSLGVAVLADALREVEHDGDGEGMVFPGQPNQPGAVFGANAGRIHDGEATRGEPFAGDELQHFEGVPGDRLIGGIVADHGPASVGGNDLRRRKMFASKRRLAGAGRADQHEQAVFGNRYAHRRKRPICVGAPNASSIPPTGSNSTA